MFVFPHVSQLSRYQGLSGDLSEDTRGRGEEGREESQGELAIQGQV